MRTSSYLPPPYIFCRRKLFLAFIVAGLFAGSTAFCQGENCFESLIEQLGSAKYKSREAAQRALDALGEDAVIALENALRRSLDLETRRRVEVLIARIKQRRQVHLFKGHAEEVLQVVFLPDSRHIVSASKDLAYLVWDLELKRQIGTFGKTPRKTYDYFDPERPEESVRAANDRKALQPVDIGCNVALSLDGTMVLTSDCLAVRLWHLATGKELRTFRESFGGMTRVAFSPDGRYAIGSNNFAFYTWKTENGEVARHQLIIERGGASAFSPNGTRIVIASEQSLKVYELATGKLLGTLGKHSNPVPEELPDLRFVGPGLGKLGTPLVHFCSVALASDGNRILSGGVDNSVRLWDLDTKKEVRCFKGHTKAVHCVAFSPDGRRALSGSDDGTVRLWDLQSGKELRCFEGHTDAVLSIAFSPDATRAVSGGRDKTVRIWALPK